MPLTVDVSEPELFALARAGDDRARERLVERFMPLAASVARRFFKTQADHEDLLQVAALALVKAMDRYDPTYGTAFSSFAIPTISGELKRFFRDAGWGMRVPRGLQERSLEVEATLDELEPSLRRSPTVSEVARYLGRTPEEVIEALDVAHARALRGLEALSDDDDDEGFGRFLGTEEHGYEVVDELVSLAPSFSALAPREREILRLRFGEDLSQSEIARRLGISQMHVSRLIRRSLDSLAQGSAPQAAAA